MDPNTSEETLREIPPKSPAGTFNCLTLMVWFPPEPWPGWISRVVDVVVASRHPKDDPRNTRLSHS